MSTGTIGGHPALRATLTLPRSGPWYADVETTETTDVLTGAQTLVLAGLTLKGTIVNGGPYGGHAWYKIVGGTNGWAKTIPEKSYRGEIGIKLSTVAGDAAKACGETLGTFTDSTLGPAYMYPKTIAARVLDLVAPEAWYVDELGVTQLGVRAAKKFTLHYQLLEKRLDRQWVTIAAEDITGLVPGAQLEGLEAASIRHELTSDGIRSHVFGIIGTPMGSRLLQILKRIFQSFDFKNFYKGSFEFHVTGGSGGYLDLAPARTNIGLPKLGNVRMFVGVPGGRGDPQMGSSVVVGFLDADPARPYIHSYDGEIAGGFIPPHTGIYGPDVKMGDAAARYLAHSLETVAALNALSTQVGGNNTIEQTMFTALSVFIGAISTYATAIKNVTEPAAPPSPKTDAIVSACTTAQSAVTAFMSSQSSGSAAAVAAVAAATPTLPTIKAQGT